MVAWDDDDEDGSAGAVSREMAGLAVEAFADDYDDDDFPPADIVALEVDDWPERCESEADPLAVLAAVEIEADLDADQAATEIADLDDDDLLAAAATNQTAINTAQARQLALAAQWADLHNADAMGPMVHPHGEGLVCPGGDGSPGFAEFASATLAAVLGMSATAATQLMGDALDLRHRHPMLWARLQTGGVKVWMARRVAAATRHLTREAAARVDARLATLADSLTGRRFEHTLKAAVAAADPAVAKARAEANRRRSGVWVNPAVEDGIGTLFARANACDLVAFNQALDVVAAALKVLGDPDDPDARRSKAVGILGRPQAALDLVNQAKQARKAAAEAAAARRTGTPDPELEEKADRLSRFRYAPAVLYVHLSDHTLHHCAGGDQAGGSGDDDEGDAGLVRVEDIGPLLADQVKDWLTHRDVTVKPVIDLPGLPGIDGYETPGWLTEAVHLRTPADCSPYSANLSRRKDIDHTIPYRHPQPDGDGGSGGGGGGGSGGGSPPQTRLGNLGPLTRANHRLKTFSGWQVQQPRSGVFVWRDPTGRHYLVDGNGTTPLGKL